MSRSGNGRAEQERRRHLWAVTGIALAVALIPAGAWTQNASGSDAGIRDLGQAFEQMEHDALFRDPATGYHFPSDVPPATRPQFGIPLDPAGNAITFGDAQPGTAAEVPGMPPRSPGAVYLGPTAPDDHGGLYLYYQPENVDPRLGSDAVQGGRTGFEFRVPIK